MKNETEPVVIESAAGEVTAELARRGIAPDQRVLVAVALDDWLAEARAFARPLVEAAGWSDEHIDRMIEEERDAVQQRAE